MPKNNDEEKLLLDEATALSKAKPFGRFDENGKCDDTKIPADDPYAKDIAPSLLNSGDIKKYVLATGLISPFYEGGGSKSRMKDASYEGRIGKTAYLYEHEKTEPTQIFAEGDRVLKVPANSIVFVESDLYFRIPDFVALRFNLQIKHVHRGLLLGTGPLIDPGYWGKLCIPLHNLTDEDYYIPADEGLIWIEFTKTTKVHDRVGRPPLGEEFKDIKPFIEKASRRFDRPSKKVGIRSSIDGAIEKSAVRAEKAETAARKARNTIYSLGLGAAIAAAIGLTGILLSSVLVIKSYNKDVRSLEAELHKHIELLNGNVADVAQPTVSSLSEDIDSLSTNVANLTTELEVERSKTQRFAEIVEALVQSDRANTSRFESLLEHCASVSDDEKPEFCAIVSN